jgi:uncharacterized protein YbjT (DUF2867 family)
MKFENVLLIGGNGFIGLHVASALAAQTKRITVVCRRRDHAKHLLPLPTADIVQGDIWDDEVLARALQGKDAVINLAGILQGSRGSPYGKEFRRAHVELPKRLIEFAAKAGVSRLLHMSALGVSDNKGPSMYLRSKADGESAVRQSALHWTIFRPSVVFGPGDSFLNAFARLAALVPFFPVAKAGARLQPIFVQDVAKAFVNALDNPLTFGKTYELAGPTVYTLGELVGFAAQAAGHPRPVLRLPSALGRLQAMLMEMLPGTPMLSRDNLDSLMANCTAENPPAPELGIVPTAMEPVALEYLAPVSTPSEMDRLRTRAHR